MWRRRGRVSRKSTRPYRFRRRGTLRRSYRRFPTRRRVYGLRAGNKKAFRKNSAYRPRLACSVAVSGAIAGTAEAPVRIKEPLDFESYKGLGFADETEFVQYWYTSLTELPVKAKSELKSEYATDHGFRCAPTIYVTGTSIDAEIRIMPFTAWSVRYYVCSTYQNIESGSEHTTGVSYSTLDRCIYTEPVTGSRVFDSDVETLYPGHTLPPFYPWVRYPAVPFSTRQDMLSLGTPSARGLKTIFDVRVKYVNRSSQPRYTSFKRFIPIRQKFYYERPIPGTTDAIRKQEAYRPLMLFVIAHPIPGDGEYPAKWIPYSVKRTSDSASNAGDEEAGDAEMGDGAESSISAYLRHRSKLAKGKRRAVGDDSDIPTASLSGKPLFNLPKQMDVPRALAGWTGEYEPGWVKEIRRAYTENLQETSIKRGGSPVLQYDALEPDKKDIVDALVPAPEMKPVMPAGLQIQLTNRMWFLNSYRSAALVVS
ncbi:hypothetical protein AX17_004422 [Amanita inopinata Kibby_2008]|nr:hypothetical protein AX17_004422 [Amanita inopinata Kibby_2008]